MGFPDVRGVCESPMLVLEANKPGPDMIPASTAAATMKRATTPKTNRSLTCTSRIFIATALLLFTFAQPLTRRAEMDDSPGPAKSRKPQKDRQSAASHHVVEPVGQRPAHGPHRYWCQESRYQTGG